MCFFNQSYKIINVMVIKLTNNFGTRSVTGVNLNEYFSCRLSMLFPDFCRFCYVVSPWPSWPTLRLFYDVYTALILCGCRFLRWLLFCTNIFFFFCFFFFPSLLFVKVVDTFHAICVWLYVVFIVSSCVDMVVVFIS